MTNADLIRSFSDEELALMFVTIVSETEHYYMDKLKEAGIDADLIEFFGASFQSQLEYLQSEA